jgi:predicted  nucleic acid-binding Zn-ribbon protein
MSASDWRNRSQKIEAQFDALETRTEKAEDALTAAQRTTVQTRKQLRATEKTLATEANQVAFTKDLREEICEAFPELVPDARARLCS